MEETDIKSLAQQWDWNDDAEDAFVDWFNSPAGPYTFMSEHFYGDCKIGDEKTRESMMYKWLHLAFVTGYMYGIPAGAADD